MDDITKQLIASYQRDFPLSVTPYADIARELGVEESTVINAIMAMRDSGIITRLGPVFNHHQAGASTLAAIAVPDQHLDEIAATVTAYSEVNHNYAREHEYNLWFVATAPDEDHLQQVLTEIEQETGYPVLKLPMEKAYHIDLGFKPEGLD